jgi:hypothetical protein
MLNHLCNLGMKLTWSWCMIFPIFCWIWFTIFYWGFLHQCSLRRLAYSSFSFLDVSLSSLGSI